MESAPMLRRVAWARMLVLSAIPFTAVVGIACSIVQFADGSLFEYVMLRDSKIWVGSTRQEVHVLTQLPTYVGLKVGITSIPVLTFLLGLGMVALPSGCWFLSLWLHRRTSWFWVLAGGWALSTLCSFAAFTEANLTYGLCAVVAAVVLLPRALRRREVGLLLLAGLSLLASYETMLFLGPLLGAGCLLRCRPRSGTAPDAPWVRPWLCATGGLLALSALSSVIQLATASNPDGASSYLDLHSIVTTASFLQLLLTTGILVILGLAAWSARHHRVLSGICGLLGVLLLIPTFWAQPSVEFSSRVLVGCALFMIFGVALLFRFVITPPAPPRPQWVTLAMAGLVSMSAVHLIALDFGFRTWRSHLTTAVRTHSGYVEFSKSGLSRSEFDRYGWSWTNPVMSMLLMNAPNQGVIGNPAPDFQPINPHRPSAQLSKRYLHP